MNCDNTNEVLQQEQKIGLCGFKNIGNTCYMNSILQLLIHSNLLLHFIVSRKNPYKNNENSNGKYVEYLNKGAICRIGEKERKRLNLSEDDVVKINSSDINNFIKDSIITRLAEIIDFDIYKGNSCITPVNFKNIIDKKIPNFRGWGQQDAHELLIQILDNIIDETGIEIELKINNVPDIIKEYNKYLLSIKKRIISANSDSEKQMIIHEFNNYKTQNKKIINKYNGLCYMMKVFKNKYNPMIFKLKTFIINTITCQQCKNETCNYENTTILTLPIRDNLNDCFEQMQMPEEIENYKCDVCKERVNAIKISKIWQFGMSLYLHFKRFKILPNGRILKDNTNIEIPHNINLTKFCDESMKTSSTIDYNYKLRGICNHYGNMGGGHYTADCLSIIDDKTWYNFDDKNVSKYNNSNINMSSAYILLYELES